MKNTITQDEISAFVASVTDSGRSPATARGYSADLRMFLNWLDDTESPNLSLSAARWLNTYRATLAPKTTARRLISIRAYFAWAGIDEGALGSYKKPVAKKPVPHPLNDGMEAIRSMMNVAKNSTQRTLVALQGFGGMRIAEALSVTVADVNTRTGVITVRGKGDKERDIPFNLEGDAFTVILDRIQAVGTGKLVDMPDRTARYTITALAKKAGVSSYTKQAVSSHDLRATAATSLYVSSGHDIRLVQEFLGHSSTAQTEVYVGVSKERFAAAVAGL